jgi:metal-responsive CopG/Arc/MetJ family transcriptional regulator
MKRATLSLPDDLAEAVDNYLRAQEVPPTLTAVVQTALREYLRERGFLQGRRPLKIRRNEEAGEAMSENHDLLPGGR